MASDDCLVADPILLSAHGVGEAIMHVPEEPAAFLSLSTMSTMLPGDPPVEGVAWYALRVAYRSSRRVTDGCIATQNIVQHAVDFAYSS